MISCSCNNFDGIGIYAVGDPRLCHSRQDRKCYACDSSIENGDWMYMQSFYNFEECQTAGPSFLCEECGDMALNLNSIGYCYDFGSSLKNQWFEYLRDKIDPL